MALPIDSCFVRPRGTDTWPVRVNVTLAIQLIIEPAVSYIMVGIPLVWRGHEARRSVSAGVYSSLSVFPPGANLLDERPVLGGAPLAIRVVAVVAVQAVVDGAEAL